MLIFPYRVIFFFIMYDSPMRCWIMALHLF